MTPQNRHTAAPRRAHHRLLGDGRAACRQPGMVFRFLGGQHPRQLIAGSPTPTAQTTTSSAPTSTARPMFSRRDRRRRPALLPEHRRQDPPLRRQGQPPRLPGARRPRRPTRSTPTDLHQPALDVQLGHGALHKGLEKLPHPAPGYAIEYDYFDPATSKSSLETKSIGGLFFAGQINGTTG